MTSVAIIADGVVEWSAHQEAPMRASETVMELLTAGLTATGRSLSDFQLFAADTGPGSFTGVRVGIMVAKSFAYLHGRCCVGADAFDLIDPKGPAAVPSRRNEWFVRTPGVDPIRTGELTDEVRLGPPYAERFAAILAGRIPVTPEAFLPAYLIDPSISTPKTRAGGAR